MNVMSQFGLPQSEHRGSLKTHTSGEIGSRIMKGANVTMAELVSGMS